MGMVFQSFALWPHMTVRQHVEFPLQCRNKDLSAAEKEKRIAHALEATGLNGLEDRYPDELSGGQKQRVSSPGPSCPARRCSSWMNRCPHWTRTCAFPCGRRSAASTASRAPR